MKRAVREAEPVIKAFTVVTGAVYAYWVMYSEKYFVMRRNFLNGLTLPAGPIVSIGSNFPGEGVRTPSRKKCPKHSISLLGKLRFSGAPHNLVFFNSFRDFRDVSLVIFHQFFNGCSFRPHYNVVQTAAWGVSL